MSEFTLYPAIDMRNGKCVRLVQGDYDQETIYGDSPLDMARRFANEGAKWIHLVDLDGAKSRKTHESRACAGDCFLIRCECPNWRRHSDRRRCCILFKQWRIESHSWQFSGVKPGFVKKCWRNMGRKIAIGIDARNGFVSTEGWLETSEVKAEELGKELAKEGAEVFIFTDIQMDGMLSGPNVESTVRLAEATGKQVIASGGVSAVGDLQKAVSTKADRCVWCNHWQGAVHKAIYFSRSV